MLRLCVGRTGYGETRMVSDVAFADNGSFNLSSGGVGKTGKLIEVRGWEKDTFVSAMLHVCVHTML